MVSKRSGLMSLLVVRFAAEKQPFADGGNPNQNSLPFVFNKKWKCWIWSPNNAYCRAYIFIYVYAVGNVND